MFRIEFVETLNKKKPFDDFINGLNLKERVEVFVAINKFCDLKNKNIIIPTKITKYVEMEFTN